MRSSINRDFFTTVPSRIGWVITAGFALGISAWSIFILAHVYYRVPFVLAIGASSIFDGSALVIADLVQKYARTADSGFVPRIYMYLLIGASAWLNNEHAAMAKLGFGSHILFIAAPIVPGIQFEMTRKWVHRNEMRRVGRVAKALPPFGLWTWLKPWANIRKIIRMADLRRDSIPVDYLVWSYESNGDNEPFPPNGDKRFTLNGFKNWGDVVTRKPSVSPTVSPSVNAFTVTDSDVYADASDGYGAVSDTATADATVTEGYVSPVSESFNDGELIALLRTANNKSEAVRMVDSYRANHGVTRFTAPEMRAYLAVIGMTVSDALIRNVRSKDEKRNAENARRVIRIAESETDS